MLRVIRTMNGLGLVRDLRDDAGDRVRVLQQGGVWQSSTYLDGRRMEPVFEYYRAFGRAFDLVPSASRLLMVGGGGFAFPKLVAATHPEVRLDAVEIDAAVIKAARRWFFLDEACELMRAGGGELRVVCDDGRRVLDSAEAGSYDALVMDAFCGAEPVRSLATLEAAEAARRSLADGGVYLANVVDVDFLRDAVATLGEVFAHVEIAPATDDLHSSDDNYLVVASDRPLDLPDAIPYDADFLGEVLRD